MLAPWMLKTVGTNSSCCQHLLLPSYTTNRTYAVSYASKSVSCNCAVPLRQLKQLQRYPSNASLKSLKSHRVFNAPRSQLSHHVQPLSGRPHHHHQPSTHYQHTINNQNASRHHKHNATSPLFRPTRPSRCPSLALSTPATPQPPPRRLNTPRLIPCVLYPLTLPPPDMSVAHPHRI